MTSQADAQRAQVIAQWLAARDNAEAWSRRERELRDFIAKAAFGHDPANNVLLPDGTHRIELGDGTTLKFVAKTNYSVDKIKIEHPLSMLRSMEGGYVIAETLLSYKPTLLTAGYKKASEYVRKLLEPAITTKPAAPELELEKPK